VNALEKAQSMAARMLEVANLIIEVFEPPFRYEIALEFPVYVSRLRTATCSATIILGKLHIGVQDASIREPWAAWVSAAYSCASIVGHERMVPCRTAQKHERV
jgi:hypothetical protein